MQAVAEGVETEVQAGYLCGLDCDAAQGFDFGATSGGKRNPHAPWGGIGFA